jgi:2-phospho-L-lactate guanylyltransferase
MGADAIDEPAGVRGINQALEHALKLVSPQRLSALLVVLADVPAVTSGEIEAVLDALPADRGAVICPSSAGGTSALALRPPEALPFRFGPGSFAAHEKEATERGVPLSVLHFDSLSRDIDEPDDLLFLLSLGTNTAAHDFLVKRSVARRLIALER